MKDMMKNNFVTVKCDIFHRDEKVGRLEIENGKLIKNEVYTDNILIHPFPRAKTFLAVASGLRDRVICPERCDKAMLNHMGLNEYNVYSILHHTHGVDIDDFIWFKFDEDPSELSWKDVKVRG